MLIAGGALVAAVVVAFLLMRDSSEDSPELDFGSAELRIQDNENRNRSVTAEELAEAFPLPIQLPEYVPDGYELTRAFFFEPPPGLDRLTFASNLMVQYRRSNSSGLTLSQRPGSNVGTTDVPVEEVKIRGTTAHYSEVTVAEGIQTLMWARCGRFFMLESAPLRALPKEELVRVAESVGPEDCPEQPAPAVRPTFANGRFGAAWLSVEDADGRSRASDLDEFESAYPGDIFLPSFLPDDHELQGATLQTKADAAATSVVTVYGGGGSAGFILIQRGDSFLTPERLSRAQHVIHGAPAFLEYEQPGTRHLFWDRCEQSFMLTAPPQTISEADLVRIAESIGPADC